jgi:sn-glycerol 3-phosphate transport system ATP-binding protein
MATVTLKNIKKSFGKTDVIHGVDIDIEDGEFIVIVGPSGCGKSTLLRMVAGLETVSAGEVHIGGKLVNDKEPMDRDIAMVFQNYALYPHMTVFDNMAYALKIAGTAKSEIIQRVEDAAKLLQLEPYLKRRPRELSGGQRQRVAMGRAIVRKPAVFLFDEPLSNLDAKLRVQMRLEIKQLQRRLGVTSIYVTHDQVEAMTLADRMIVMNGGRADQVGAPLEVYANPATEFVAGFIGSPPMNFLKNEAVIQTVPGAASLGIRPEQIALSDIKPRLEGQVLYTEALGAETIVYIKLPTQEVITVRQGAKQPLPMEGTTVGLDWAEEDQMLFDSSGNRISARHALNN